MRRVLIAGLVAASAAACTGGGANVASVPPPSIEGSRVLAEPESTVAPTTSSSTTTTTLAPALSTDGVARALISTTNIVLPVLESRDDGWVVRTPCQEVAFILEGTPVDRVHVVIDPGHGGSESGAVAPSGTSEADLNLAVSTLVADQLSELGFSVVLTRYGDYRLPIVSRVEIADTLEADLLISIHHQGLGDVPVGERPGTEIYYQQGSSESKRFAGLLHEGAIDELGAYDIEWFVGPDAGATFRPDAATGDDFYGMVRRPETTAVLAEMAFMGNPSELDLLMTPEFRAAEATAVTGAVVRWFTTEEPGSGFVEPSFALSSSGGGGGLGNCVDPDLGASGEVPADSVGVLTESG